MTRRRTAAARAFASSPRRTIALGVAAIGLLVPASSMGAGATYTVIQCHSQNRGFADAQIQEPRPYGITTGCSDPASENAIQINNRLSAENGREGSVRWIAPEATGFVRVRAEAKLRRAAGHYSRLYMADAAGRQTRRIAYGDGSPGAFRVEAWDGQRQQQFVGVLGCDQPSGCPESNEAKTWLRNVRLTLADYADPEVAVSGSLTTGGWKRGEQQLDFGAQDVGSGLELVVVKAEKVELARANGDCTGRVGGTALASRTQPCTSEIVPQRIVFNTAAAPFHDGANTLSTCAQDFAGNEACATRHVMIDNTAPTAGFANGQDVEDPELIRAVVTDAHSGVAGGLITYRPEGEALWTPLETTEIDGELRARVDSTAVPAGTYEFRATATDVAGNAVETTRRQDGQEMRLEFPLKAGVRLSAALKPGGAKRVTIPYGRRSRAHGVLRAATGEPIANQEIVVEEFFGQGALIRERITRIRTGPGGRWESKLPAGPSRRVTAHYAGDPQYLAASKLGGSLAVRTKASLRTSERRVPEGKRVVFKGKLGHRGARIPRGGKLLELQVKQDTRTYQTVGQGFRSKPSGRYRIAYRFGRFYQYDVRFKFRVKVAREADWPYKAPVRSKSRTITVLDR